MYHLGEVMNIQASLLMAEHASFRLVMDSCVVTLEPNAASLPRYMFIQNHGSVGIWDFPVHLKKKKKKKKPMIS